MSQVDMPEPAARTLRSALFVDFDNIYSGLASLDRGAANSFATDPGRWLNWLERGVRRTDEFGSRGQSRRILVRHCYLNPQEFAAYRTGFQRAAFRVIDCPPLTRQAKTSTDIHMVMDILDLLRDDTHFDEFIILSGDADFTPVLLRLRANDRRTIVLAVGPAATAYTNAADLLLSERDLFDELFERDEDSYDDVLYRILSAFEEEVFRRGSMDVAAQVNLLRSFEEFRSSTNWLGYGGHLRLAQHLCGASQQLALRVVPDGQFYIDPVVQRNSSPAPQAEGADLERRGRQVLLELLERGQVGHELVTVAAHVQAKLGVRFRREEGWFGHSSLQLWLTSALPAGWRIVRRAGKQPLILPDALAPTDDEEVVEAPLAVTIQDPLMQRVRQVTDIPLLSPEKFQQLFEAIVADVHVAPYAFLSTGKAVREASGISRAVVSFVLRGISQGGVDLREVADGATPSQLAEAFAYNVLRMCEAARLELSEEEEDHVRRWISGHWHGAIVHIDEGL